MSRPGTLTPAGSVDADARARALAHDGFGDVGELPPQPRRREVMRSDLQPWQQAVSLAPPPDTAAATLAPLTRYLGPALTVASPAWSRKPLPALRALQRKLVEYSLTLPAGERGACMDAIRVVEGAVQLRLRWEQMDMQLYGMDEEGDGGDAALGESWNQAGNREAPRAGRDAL
jgi:hypothetical protein